MVSVVSLLSFRCFGGFVSVVSFQCFGGFGGSGRFGGFVPVFRVLVHAGRKGNPSTLLFPSRSSQETWEARPLP